VFRERKCSAIILNKERQQTLARSGFQQLKAAHFSLCKGLEQAELAPHFTTF